MLSYFADIDIIAVSALGQWPGIAGMFVAVAVFTGMLWPVLRVPHPLYPPVALVAVVTGLAHLAAVWLSALVAGSGLAPASAAVSQLVLRGPSAVLLLAAAVAAWIAVALRRTRARPPHWPWERAADEE
ncbi:hypothetical protein JRG78_10475 [Microbacterium sp. EF45047]|nr:hypothetical protein JSY13_10490 [Microbacterium neungamense]WCM56899.1 hypothetical protein JRG78_10475 [Microbacterium sp. EF45047]